MTEERRRLVRKITPALKRKVCEAIANGASPTRAAKAIGVSRSALYYQRDVDPDFREAWAEALETQADMYEDALQDAAIEKHNIGGIIFGLKNLRSDKWKDRHEVTERPPAKVDIARSIGPGQREALIKVCLDNGEHEAAAVLMLTRPQLTEAPQEAGDGTDAP